MIDSSRTSVASPPAMLQRPDAPGAVVAVVVAALPHVAAGDRATVRVAVLRDRHDEMPGAVRLLRLEGVRALVDVPAVVLEAGARARRVVDLLPLVLPDVADVEVAATCRRRTATGCAARSRRSPTEGLRALTLIVSSLPRRLERFCAWFCGVTRRAAVAHPDVEPPVRARTEAARRCGSRTAARTKSNCRRRFGRNRAVRPVLDDARVAVQVGVVDVELVVRPVVRVERHREQSLLAARAHDAMDVEERLGAQLAVAWRRGSRPAARRCRCCSARPAPR